MSFNTTEASLDQAIRNAVHKFVADLVEKEIKESAERIETKIRDSIPQIIMGVAKYYDVYNDRDRVVITVRPEQAIK